MEEAVILATTCLVVGLAVGFLYRDQERARAQDRVRRLLRGYALLWLRAPGPNASRAVHDALDEAAPELHEEFHVVADELLADGEVVHP